MTGVFYLTDDDLGSFNGCSKTTYEKIAAVLLHILPMHFSIEGEDLPENKREELVYFYEKHKQRFFDRRCLKRPVYTLKVNEEGGVVHDKEGVQSYSLTLTAKEKLKAESVSFTGRPLKMFKGICIMCKVPVESTPVYQVV